MPHSIDSPDQKFEGFDIWVIRAKSEALQAVQELKEKPEMLKAVQKYIKDEIQEARGAIDLAENL